MTEWNASEYNKQSSLQQAMAAELLQLLQIEGSERVLDVGCGDGKITDQIAARVSSGSVLGVDPSRDMIRFASEHFGAPIRSNLSFEVADARHMPYRDEFDLVVSFNALHWVPEQDQALSAIRMALRPDGQTLLRFVAEGPRQCLEDTIEQVRKEPRWAKYFSGFQKPYAHFTIEQYHALAEQAGFRVLRLDIEDKAWDFQTQEGFFAFARATFVEWAKHLPESEHPAFITEVLDRYRSIASSGPGEENLFKFYQMAVVLTPAGS